MTNIKLISVRREERECSKRIHLLKCEKGGWDETCEVSERWYKEGEAKGEMKAKEKEKVIKEALKHFKMIE